MAKIVLGMGASHGPLLATPPEQWGGRVEADRRNPALVYRDGTFKFEELAKLRAKENLEQQIELPVKQKRYDACQRAMAEMARVFKEAKPDVAILVGNDQMEVFEDANIPAFLVCFGETVDNIPFSEEQKKRSAARHRDRRAEPSRQDRADLSGPSQARPPPDRDADAVTISTWRRRRGCRNPLSSNISGLPHAYGFIYRRIMQENYVPAVPLFINTFYPPNQPSVRRCFALGEALGGRDRHPGTRTCASPSSAPAACRISWSTRSSTAASSTPCSARTPTP